MNSQGLRLAAVKLAALHADDRQWLLAQLAPTQAMALRTLLRDSTLQQFAQRLGTAMATVSVEPVADAPAAPTTVSPPLPADLKTLSPAWAALWLSVHAPDDMEQRLEDVDPRRTQRILEEARHYRKGMPSALAHAVAQWGGAQ